MIIRHLLLNRTYRLRRASISIRLFSNALEHLQTNSHTLILAYTESSFSHKISCPSHLVKEQGVGLYSDPTPIYFYLSNYPSNPLKKTWGNRITLSI
jgi:hypothetical protein